MSQFTGFSTTTKNTDSPLQSDVVSQSPRMSPPPNPFSSVHQTIGGVSGGAVVSDPFAILVVAVLQRTIR